MEFIIKIILFVVVIKFLSVYFTRLYRLERKQFKEKDFFFDDTYVKKEDTFIKKDHTVDSCPHCRIGKLVKKNNKHSSVDFIGCNRFPSCRYSKEIIVPDVKPKSRKPKRTSYAEKIKKGAEFESYVTRVYQCRGYTVTEYGKEMGKKDQGIDLIAKKEKHIVLIQCKNWNKEGKWKIKHTDILAFRQRSADFLEERKIFQNYDITSRYTLSGDFIHASAIKHLEEMQAKGKKVDYEIIEMPIL